MRLFATTLALTLATSTLAQVPKKVIWAGPTTGFDNANNWAGGNPLAKGDDEDDQPEFSTFGQEDGSITGIASSGSTYVMGNKIILNGKVKIVLGDGSGGKTTLSFAQGNGGKATFLPGSDETPEGQVKMQAFDFNCHMNWRAAKDQAIYNIQPPCDGDRVYMATSDDESQSRLWKVPDGIEAGDGLYANTFGADTYFRRLYLESTASVDTDDCADGSTVFSESGMVSVDLGKCSNTKSSRYTTFMDAGPEQEKADCVSTCPPVGILDDSSWIQSTLNDDGEVEYIQIDDTGLKTDATIVAVEDDDSTTFTLTDADGIVTEHIKYNDDAAGSDIARKTTATTTTTTISTTTSTTVVGVTTDEPTTEASDDGEASNDDDDDDKNTNTDASTANGGGSSTVTIVVVVVLLLVVIAGAGFYVTKNKGGGGAAAQQGVVSFENPMYDTAQKQNPAASYAQPQQQQATSGYMDVPAGGGYAAPPQGNSGYMDVGGADAGGGGGGGGGYMDVAPNAGYGDSDEEDV